jgi:hypothetical protein
MPSDAQAIYWLQCRFAQLSLTSCMQKDHLSLEAAVAARVLPGTYRASSLDRVRQDYLGEQGSRHLLARQLTST